MTSLLPYNATSFERQLESCTVLYTTDLPTNFVADLNSSKSCHERYLPWRAWEYSVDEWNDDWLIDTKRSVVQNSFEVHQYKGTRYGIKKALESLSVKTTLKEWWERGGSGVHGVHTIQIFVNDNQFHTEIDKDSLDELYRIVNSAKRGTQHFRVELGMSLRGKLNIYGAVRASTMIHRCRYRNVLPPVDSLYGSLKMYGATKATTIVRLNHFR